MADKNQTTRIPLVEEQISVEKREAQTDHVRVRTVTDERAIFVDDVLQTGRLVVNRLPVDRLVAVAPPPRQEGATLIISLVEERLVIEKRLFVTEEVHVTRVEETETVSVPTAIRSMRAVIDHDDADQVSQGRE